MSSASETPVLLDLSTGLHKSFEGERQFTIGRSVHCSYDIPSPFISRHHCIITKNINGWSIQDTSSYKTTMVNDIPIESVQLNDGDKISFANYKEREFKFYSDICKMPPPHKKRKMEETSDNPTQPTSNQESQIKEIIIDKCNNLEKENQRLSDRVNYLRVLAEDTQRSLTVLETENKSLRDRLQKEEHSKELLSIKLQDLQDSLKESENELERIRKEIYKESVPETIVNLNLDTTKNQEDKIVSEGVELTDVMLEADYFNNFDFNTSPIPMVPSPEPGISSTSNEIHEISDSKETVNEEILSDQKKKSDKVRISKGNIDISGIVDQVELVFIEAENEALTQQLEKKNTQIASIIREKEAFRTRVLEALEHELSCSICSEILFQPVILNCKHIFCTACVTEWKKKKKECPVCRTKIKVEIPAITLDSFCDNMAEILGEEFKDRRDEMKHERKCLRKSPIISTSAKKRGRGRVRARTIPEVIDLIPFSVNLFRSIEEVIDVSHFGGAGIDPHRQNAQGRGRGRRHRSRQGFETVDLTSSPRPSTSDAGRSNRGR